MTLEMRAVVTPPLHKVLLIKDGNVILSHNHPDTGPAIPIIAALLMDYYECGVYIAGVELFDILGHLNLVMQDDVPGWRMRFTNRRRISYFKNNERRVSGRFFVDYISIDQHTNKNKRLPRRRIEIINLDLLKERPPQIANEQMEMALSILEMCDKRQVRFRSTRGGLGSAMLKRSSLWEKKRRAASKTVNFHARKYLPGNFYSLSRKVTAKKGIEAIEHCYYVDQKSAHHTIASDTPLPHPHSIHGRGYFRREGGLWTNQYSQVGRELIDGTHMGLVLARITCSHLGPTFDHIYPPWAKRGKSKLVWLWTPELRLFDGDHRLQLDYFVAAYTSTQHDPVLREYAEWALGEIASNPERAPYKKGSLLAAYGMLAFNSMQRPVYRYWGGQNSRPRVEIPRAGFVSESKVTIPDFVQLSTTNVIARGLIEAETRTRTIEYAKQLHSLGFHIPQIYADGILVETDQLPFVPNNWRISHSLHNVYIPRSNALVSDELVKLPGIGGSEQDREWERKREDARRVITADKIVRVDHLEFSEVGG